MTEVILEREFNPALSGADFLAMAAEAADCLHLYRVQWRESLLALDGESTVTFFNRPISDIFLFFIFCFRENVSEYCS
jgi:hypothetical protein